MATDQRTIDYILDQVAAAGNVSSRKMFGEYALYCEGKVVALICDDQLFVKPTRAGESYLRVVDYALPYLGAKPWFFIDAARIEDSDWLVELVRVTAADLPPPRPKRKKLAKPLDGQERFA